jgi:hypothetical protein
MAAEPKVLDSGGSEDQDDALYLSSISQDLKDGVSWLQVAGALKASG